MCVCVREREGEERREDVCVCDVGMNGWWAQFDLCISLCVVGVCVCIASPLSLSLSLSVAPY